MIEINSDEGWNAYHADDVLKGRRLYPAPDSLVTNNYPPLSFYLVAALSRVSSLDPAYVGRALSLLGIAAAAMAVAACVRQLGASRIAASFAGVWFFATSVRFFTDYVGVNDPHIVALALTLAALAWLLRRQARGRAPEPAIALMVVAGFYKHSLIATPLTALLWLTLCNWRLGLRAALFGCGLAAAGLLLCTAIYGYSFLHQLLFFPRAVSLRLAFGSLGHLQWIVVGLVAWALWAWPERHTGPARFTALYIAAGFAIYFIQKLGQQIGINALFELAAASAIGFGLAFDRAAAIATARRWRLATVRGAMIGAVTARLLLSNHLEAYYILASGEYRGRFAAHAEIARQEAARAAAVPAPAYCTIAMVCRWAGHGFVFDAPAAENLIETGRMTRAELQARMHAEGIRYIAVDPRTTAPSLERKVFAFMR